MSKTGTKYEKRGVSPGKEEVHQAIKGLDKGLFPNAFCKILPDVIAGDEAFVNIMHADTAGTKTSLAYLYWKETGDLSVWQGIVEDAVVMNVDDMACVGCLQDIVLSSTIGRNKHLITGEVIAVIINHLQRFTEKMKGFGISWHLAGGETADVGDIVRTMDVGYTAFARMKKNNVVNLDIRPGDRIVAIASYGQSIYEDRYNSGIGSNGLTSARHDVLDKSYATRFPEAFDPNTPNDVVFTGSKKLTDLFSWGSESYEVGKLLLSPTRTYVPLIKEFLSISTIRTGGLIHCTGGGQTKVLKFADKVRIVKEDLLDIPPVFRLIQSESGASWEEMFQVFNMGHRLEIYCRDDETVKRALEVASSFEMEAKLIGTVEESQRTEVKLKSPDGWLSYFA